MKLLTNNLLKLAYIMAISGIGLVSSSAIAQRGGQGVGHHGSSHQLQSERQNKKSLKAANAYLDVLEDYYLWAESQGFRGLKKRVKNLYDTVHFEIQKPLKRG